MVFYRFEHYRLDLNNACLTVSGQKVNLTPKAFDLLAFLCANPGRLIAKEALLDAVWQRRFISEGVLKNTIQELRKALGDDAKSPRYIETVPKRGYRFIAEMINEAQPPAGEECIVGREALLARLAQSLKQAALGRAEIVFLSGEPGIGKTTLIRTFMRQCADSALCAQGQCVEQYGQGEPYLPLLEAVNQLVRDGGGDKYRLLRRFAPTWLLQLSWLIEDGDRDNVHRETQSASKERMLRELAEFLRACSDVQPLILAIDDIHWSDYATLDAINYLARRKDGAKLLLLGSYRPADVAKHPFAAMRNELLLHGLCGDWPLALLSVEEVGHYLHLRRAGETVSDAVVRALFSRSEGLPLFVARVADQLDEQGAPGVETLLAAMPVGLSALIESQLERFNGDESLYLEIAAVCGQAFSAALLAQVAKAPLLTVEAWCEDLVRRQHVFAYQERRADAGAPVLSYRFIHAYYQELAYARIAPGRRASWHGSVGDCLEAEYGQQAEEWAAELAAHFLAAGRYDKAVFYLHAAGRNALRRHAAQEAVELLKQALQLLDRHYAEAEDYPSRVLALLVDIAPAMLAMQGFASQELKAVYDRALLIAEQMGHPPMLFGVLWGGWVFYFIRAELDTTLACAKRLLQAALSSGDEAGQVAGHLAIGSALLELCDLPGAVEQVQQAVALNDFQRHGEAYHQYAQDLGAAALSKYCVLLKLQGRLDEAQRQLDIALAHAEQLGQPFTLAIVLMEQVSLHLDSRDIAALLAGSRRLEQLASDNGMPLMYAFALIFMGWGLAAQGEGEQGVAIMQQAAQPLALTGTHVLRPYYLTLTAEACLAAGKIDEGLLLANQALDSITSYGVRQFEAEALRVHGELLLAAGKSAEGIASLEAALEVAERQGFELYASRAEAALAKGIGDKVTDNTET